MHRHFSTMVAVAVAVASTAAYSAAAAATPFFNSYLGSGRCYLRVYDAAHMRRHPSQTLSKFHVVAHEADPLRAKRPREYTIRFGYWVKGGGIFDGLAACKSTTAGEACSAEGDGGNFTLTPAGRSIKVMLSSRLGIEGAKSFSPNVGTHGNRTMLLPRASSGSCRRH